MYPPSDDFSPDEAQDDFVADDFVADTPVTSTPKYKTVDLGNNQLISVAEGETVEQAKARVNRRPDTRTFNAGELFDEMQAARQKVILDNTPEVLKGPTKFFDDLTSLPARLVIEGIAEPEAFVGGISSRLGRLFGKSSAPLVDDVAEEAPKIITRADRMLPEGRDTNLIVGKDARIQRRNLLTPQEEARLGLF